MSATSEKPLLASAKGKAAARAQTHAQVQEPTSGISDMSSINPMMDTDGGDDMGDDSDSLTLLRAQGQGAQPRVVQKANRVAPGGKEQPSVTGKESANKKPANASTARPADKFVFAWLGCVTLPVPI